VAENAAHAVQYFQTLFGPFPYPRLALSQIPGNFGQGWPELIYLPTLSFLSTTERSELGGGGKVGELSEQSFVAHEVAHQWWGNQLGWKTYHDQWLSEGLASYAAALYLARGKDGERKLHDLLRSYKQDLMSKTKEGNTVESGGAIWLGQRLSNSLNPQGYHNIVYHKACWVLHMLRTLMADPKTGSDERFFRMLRDFVTAQSNGDPSTEDFVRHAEKYMPQGIDLEHNKQLDWFFNEWVYGTGIPNYKLKTVTRPLDSKKYIIEGTIEQSEVPAEFEMPVPVVAVYGRERKASLGRVIVGETGGHFRFTVAAKPSRVTVDEDAVLAVVR
jgi:aminopeptidase N